MEISVVIKLADGSTRTIDLINVNLNTSWSNNPMTAVQDPAAPQVLVGILNLNGTIKDTSALGAI